jgi:alkanesulfonate monooxygenase
MAARFHWRLPPGGERPDIVSPGATDRKKVGLPDLEARTDFCRRGEELGIDSVLTAFASNMPDTMLVAAALAPLTNKIKFIVAYRPGLISPTLFVQQVNTLSTLANGRVSLNIVIGHSQQEQAGYGDFLSHDDRYERADEFLAICNALWRRGDGVNFAGKYYRIENGRLNTPFASQDRNSPEIFMAGGSPQTHLLAVKHASCWLALGERPDTLRSRIRFAVEEGIEAGLRFSIIARSTREEAIEAAAQLVPGVVSVREKRLEGRRSEESIGGSWLTRCLWSGAVASHGASAIALVGSREEIAAAILEYRELGVSQFILSGWPNLDAMTYFGREILPLIRMKESGSNDAVERASAAD